MSSQWLAVEADTDPLKRARELQRSWERLLADRELGDELPSEAAAGLRPTIVESWQRSLASGLDPIELGVPIEVDQSEVRERWLEHPLGSLAYVLETQLTALAEETQSLVVVTDASGLLLNVDGEERLKERAREMNFVEGARFSEAVDGTNGIGTALAADHALQVFACEHFNHRHHEWICSSAPVHDPVSGQILGLIDLSGLWTIAHPRSLELVATAARTMEGSLSDIRRDQDARLRRRYSDFMTRSTDLLVSRDGYVLDGDDSTYGAPLDVAEAGGEIVLDDGSAAVAEPLGGGEAFLVRRRGSRRSGLAPAEAFQPAEGRARELAREQAALRRVATLVARESSAEKLFDGVAEQVARVFDVPLVRLVRCEPEGSVVLGGFSERDDKSFPIGSHWPLETPGLIASVRESGRPARVDDYSDVPGPIAAAVRRSGTRSAVAAPVVVGGLLWGAMVLLCPRSEPLPDDTEARLNDFTELVSTAIANSDARDQVTRLLDEQTALRRVATLVARGVPPDELFVAVCDEVARLVDAEITTIGRFDRHEPYDLTVVGLSSDYRGITLGTRSAQMDWLASSVVHRTGRTARRDVTAAEITDANPVADSVRSMGFFSTVSAPIVVDGELWGVLTASSSQDSLPPNTEKRVESFGELVATALAEAQSRVELATSEARARALAEEQAALRRVATLVADGAVPPDQFFSAVAREVAAVLNVPGVIITRYEADGMAVTFGDAFDSKLSGADAFFGVGSRAPLDPGSLAAQVFETHGPARIDDFSTLEGTVGDLARAARLGSGCAGPIIVNGELWGKMCVFSGTDADLPAGTEDRLHDFIELAGTAIANYEARAELAASESRARALAEEQAVLRRIATLVASGATPDRVFDAIRDEVSRMFGIPMAILMRYDADGKATLLSTAGSYLGPAGGRWSLDGTGAVATVYGTGRPARADYSQPLHGEIAEAAKSEAARWSVGVPIMVEGALWGVLSVGDTKGSPPQELETRLEKFTELLATAIANTESRAELAASEARARNLATEQAALRRVAMLVAQGASPEILFAAVAHEVGGIIDIPIVRVNRFEPDGTFTMVGIAGDTDFTVGDRWPVSEDGLAGMILSTGRPAGKDDYSTMRGPLGDALRADHTTSTVGVPIVVDGGIWGFMVAAGRPGRPVPEGTEERLARFTELVATAVSNATTRTDLLTSRARVVSAADQTRRRLERDLHDGIQQSLVALALKARKAAALAGAGESPAEELSGLADDLVGVTDELREISRGIHPAILSDAGLDDALEALARRSAIHVDLDVSFQGRYDPTFEATVYYVVAESITNAVKHAQASTVEVRGGLRDGRIDFEIKDDGVGGADPRRGTGLVGLTDRVDTLGGTISFVSPAGAGTTIRVRLPAGPRPAEDPPLDAAGHVASSSASG